MLQKYTGSGKATAARQLNKILAVKGALQNEKLQFQMLSQGTLPPFPPPLDLHLQTQTGPHWTTQSFQIFPNWSLHERKLMLIYIHRGSSLPCLVTKYMVLRSQGQEILKRQAGAHRTPHSCFPGTRRGCAQQQRQGSIISDSCLPPAPRDVAKRFWLFWKSGQRFCLLLIILIYRDRFIFSALFFSWGFS